MAKNDPLLNNFTAGELTPLLAGAVNLDKYTMGCEIMENFLPLTHGPATFRQGTRYIAETKISSKTSRLIPFEFSTEQAYILEFGEFYLRVYKDRGQVMSGAVPYEIASPYAATDLAKLKFIQSADILYLFHPDYPVYELQRTGHTAWTFTLHTFKDGPYLDENINENLVLTPSGTTGTITLRATIKGTTVLVGNSDFSITPLDSFPPGSDTSWTWGRCWSYDGTAKEADRTGPLDIEGLSKSAACVVTWTNHGLITGDQVSIAGITQDAQWKTLNGIHSITRISVDSFSIPKDTSSFDFDYDPNVDPGTIIGRQPLSQTLSITAGKTYAVTYTLKNVTAGNLVVYLGGASGLSRSANGTYTDIITTLTTADLKFVPSFGFIGSLDDVSVIEHTPSTDIFEAGHVGSIWRLEHGTTWGYVKITTYTSPSSVSAEVQSKLGGSTPTDKWREGAFSSIRGYPLTGTFHDGRFILGGTKYQPQTIWASKVGDYENFAPEDTITDSGPFTETIASNQVNSIHWLTTSRVLVAGTSGGEYKISGAAAGDALTPTNISLRQDTAYGSANLSPVNVGNVILFWQKHGRKLRELTYNFASDSYVAPDLTILNEHLTYPSVIDMAYMKEPHQMLWAVRSDGVLLSMIYERDEKVLGWARQVMRGKVESVAAIPGPAQTEIWMIVNRTINGVEKRYVELLEDFPLSTTAQEDMFFVECGLTYDGTPVTKISGLDHLEGEEVAILADGAVHVPQTIVNGAITLEYSASVVQVGLAYTGTLLTGRLEGGSQTGTAQGKIKRIHGVTVRLNRSLGGLIGADANSLERLPLRNIDDLIETPSPLMTGDIYVDFPGDYETTGQIMIQQDLPLPLTVCALMPRVTTMDG